MSNIDFSNIQDPIARAEAMRAQAIADIFIDATSSIRSAVKTVVSKISSYLEYRRTYDVLSGMSVPTTTVRPSRPKGQNTRRSKTVLPSSLGLSPAPGISAGDSFPEDAERGLRIARPFVVREADR